VVVGDAILEVPNNDDIFAGNRRTKWYDVLVWIF
jgi:hypothetical protein